MLIAAVCRDGYSLHQRTEAWAKSMKVSMRLRLRLRLTTSEVERYEYGGDEER